MSKVTFKKSLLVDELGLPFENDPIVKCNHLTDSSRWSLVYDLVFEYKGKFYKTDYRIGATESQEEEPWEWEDEITCEEVELKEVMVEKWVTKDE